MFIEKTTEQLRAIFGLGKKRDLDKEALEYIAARLTNNRTCRLSKLSFDEANLIIVDLGGDAFPSPGVVAKRTENYRKQKAGVKTIESARQIKLIRDLAKGRGMSEDGISRLATRMRLPWPPNTTEQGNKLTEALKAMNARDVRTGSGSDRIPGRRAA